MKRLKKIWSLTVGFVACALAGLFAMQMPTPTETVADTTGYTQIDSVAVHGVSTSEYVYAQFLSGGVVQEINILYPQTQENNEDVANFAKQVKVIRGGVEYSAYDTVTIMGRYDGGANNSGINVGFDTIAGDEIIFPQGTTFTYDTGTHSGKFVFASSFKIVCASTGVSVANLGACAETAVNDVVLVKGVGSDAGAYLRFGNFPYLSLTDNDTTNEKTSDRNSEDIANWAKQMIFATSEDGVNYTYHNYYDYVLELLPNALAIQVQDSINVNFQGFQNEFDTLIIPKGITLRWDYNNDYVWDYNWVMGQTVSLMRWKGSATSNGMCNCTEFKNSTGFTCADNEANSLYQGYFHLLKSAGSSFDVTTITSSTTTDNTASLTLNNNTLEFPSKYAIDASTWTYNGEKFTDVCDIDVSNGYLTITKKEGKFAHKDHINIPAGTAITNTITGTTYNFPSLRQLYYIRGTWYSFDTYYEVTRVSEISNNTVNNLYVWFTDSNGNAVNNGYNMAGGDGNTGGWYNPDANMEAFRTQIVSSVSIDRIQVGGQASGLYFYNTAGAFATSMTFTIPQGSIWYANAKNNVGVTAQVLWYFPYAITVTVNSANTYTQIIAGSLPEAPATTGNNVFVGYKLVSIADGSVQPKLYQPGEAYDPTTYTYEAVTLEMYMEKGASVRLSEVDGINGIRYTVNVNKVQLQSIKDTFGVTINLGLRIRVVNSAGKISKTESNFTAITDVLGVNQAGNCRESGNYLVYTVAYVMHDSYITLETNNNYQWLGDGFIEIVNSDSTTIKAFAVQNDNARSYRWLLHYYINQSWTEEATETNVYEIMHTLSDGSTQVRYYGFYLPTYKVLLAEAERAGVLLTDNK